jgi:hypothetical protein
MTCTLDYFKIIRSYEQRRVRTITDDAQLRMKVPCEQGTSGIRVSWVSLPIPKGTVLFGGTHDRGAFEWEHYAFSYFYPITDTDEGQIVRLDTKDFEMVEVVQ